MFVLTYFIFHITVKSESGLESILHNGGFRGLDSSWSPKRKETKLNINHVDQIKIFIASKEKDVSGIVPICPPVFSPDAER